MLGIVFLGVVHLAGRPATQGCALGAWINLREFLGFVSPGVLGGFPGGW